MGWLTMLENHKPRLDMLFSERPLKGPARLCLAASTCRPLLKTRSGASLHHQHHPHPQLTLPPHFGRESVVRDQQHGSRTVPQRINLGRNVIVIAMRGHLIQH